MEIFSGSSGLEGAVESLIGGRRENQDSYGMASTPLGYLVVVCDGMGGGPAGKQASSLAVNAIIDFVSRQNADSNAAQTLGEAAFAAGEAIQSAVRANPALDGMGTTCVALLVADNNACVMHIGDSRLYQMRGAECVFRTADHSYVGELVRRGALTEEEARNSNYSNIITRAIGACVDILPEVDQLLVRPGDSFAIMTDGIWGALPEPHLIELLTAREDVGRKVEMICSEVDQLGQNKGGHHDNLTLAVCNLIGETPVGDFDSSEVAISDGTNSSVESGNYSESDSEVSQSAFQNEGVEEYKLMDYADDEPELRKSKMPVILWSLVAVLVLSLALNAFLFYQHSLDSEKKDTQNLVAKYDSVPAANGDTILPQENPLPIAENSEQTPAPVANVPKSSYTPSQNDNYGEEVENVDPPAPAISPEDIAAAQKAINESVDVLNRLANLKPEGRPDAARFEKRHTDRRNAFMDHAVDPIKKAAAQIENPELRNRLMSAASEIEASRNATASKDSFDKKGLTTPAARQQITSLISTLNSILN